MKKILNRINRVAELQSLSIIFLEQMDSAIKPIDRFILLRLVVSYGGRKLPKTQLKQIAKNVQVHPTRLNESLKILKEFGLIRIENKKIGVNFRECFRELSYKRINQSKHDKTAYELVKFRYKQSRLLFKLFEVIFDVRISHMQKNVTDLMEMNYQQWLVLVNLVMCSDSRGIVKNVGTHFLAFRTGMSRDALLRAITKLFELKIIQSKVHGTLNNNLLATDTPIYYLNLSAEIWKEHRRYGTYFFYKAPENLKSVSNCLFEYLKKYKEQDRMLRLDALKRLECGEGYYIGGDHVSKRIIQELDFASNQSEQFINSIRLLNLNFKENKKSLNTYARNVERIDFFLRDCFAQDIENFQDVELFDTEYIEKKVKLSNLTSDIKKIYLDKEDSLPAGISMQDLLSTLEMLRSEILCIVAQVIYRNELKPILLSQFKIEDRFRITYLPSPEKQFYDCIYFIENISLQMKDNKYKSFKFQPASGSDIEYKIQCSDITIEDLKEYGISI